MLLVESHLIYFEENVRVGYLAEKKNGVNGDTR
jgi:hypothetical protein